LDISKALERLKSVNIKGGIFGKTTTLMVVLSICVSGVTIATGIWWITLILMVPLMGMVFYAFKRTLDFAENHPQAAIMDGAEFLIHEKLLFAQKGKDLNILEQPTVLDHTPPEFTSEEVTSPDPPPSKALSDTDSAVKGGE